MELLKKYIKDNNVKNVVVQRFFRNIQINIDKAKNPGSVEIFFLVKYLIEECGVEPTLIYHTKQQPTGYHKWLHQSEVDWSTVDLCINQTNLYNLFGGHWEKREIEHIDNWTNNYQGLTYVLFTDPLILWTNPYRLMTEGGRNTYRDNRYEKTEPIQFHITPEQVQLFENKEVDALFIGKDYDKFKNTNIKFVVWPEYALEFKMASYIVHNELQKIQSNIIIPEEKEWDVVYFGSYRGNYRGKTFKKLFNSDNLKKLWIGHDPKMKNTEVIDSVHRSGLGKYLQRSKLSFVMGDLTHNDNIFTYRIFENSLMKCLSIIWNEFDTEHTIFQNPELTKFYVSEPEQVEGLIQHLDEDPSRYDYYLNLQREEILAFSKEWKH